VHERDQAADRGRFDPIQLPERVGAALRRVLGELERGRIALQPVKLYAVDQDRTLVGYLTDPAGDVCILEREGARDRE